MFDYRWIAAEHRYFAAAHELDQLDALLKRSDVQVVNDGHRRRQTVLLEVDDGAGPRRYFLKRERGLRLKDACRLNLTWPPLTSKARQELAILRRLRAAGIDVPEPVACLQAGLWPVRACLIVAELAGMQPLSEFLSERPFADDSPWREPFFASIGREIARLHRTGINQPDLYANHVFVTSDGPPCRVAFIDFQRSRQFTHLLLEARAADFAALLATLPHRLATEADRQVLSEAYLASCLLEHRAAEFQAAVEMHEGRLLTRRKIWEIRESDTEPHRSVQTLEPCLAEPAAAMWTDRRFRSELEGAGLTSVTAVMQTQRGQQLRALPDRENWRLELDGPHGRRGAYLKKHHVRDFGTWLAAKAGRRPRHSAGSVEAQNVARLGRGGIAAMQLIAYGEALHEDGQLDSFLITEELAGFTQLDHFLRARFAETKASPQRDPDLLTLLDEVADVAARFHKLGYNHRDLYCCHFFIHENTPGAFQVNLIDLQRVEHRRRFRGRWIVKDLAQLAYSAPRERVSCAQKMRFIKRYLGVRKLRTCDKRLIRRVLFKQRLMEWKHGKHP